MDTIHVSPTPDGSVTIGAVPAAPAGVSFVSLPGAILMVDPTDAAGVPHATVTHREAASGAISALYGADVADALEAPAPVDVPIAESAQRADAVHLGVLFWLSENLPVPLDGALLDLEAAVVRASLPYDAEDDPLGPPDRIATLAEMARRLRAEPGLPLADELARLFRRACIDVPRSEDTAARSAFNHERELLLVQAAYGSSTWTDADARWLAGQLTPVAATHLGRVEEARGTASLDWLRVPSALLPAAEGTVSFSIEPGPRPRVVVSVPAPPPTVAHPAVPRDEAPPPQVIASLRSFSWPVPLAEGVLAFDGARRAWTGAFPLAPDAVGLAGAADLLDVDVRSARVPWASPSRRRVREAAARRWAARGLALTRLGRRPGDPTLARASAESFRYAARLWAPTATATAARCRALASGVETGDPLSLAEKWLLASGGTPHA